MTVCRKKKKKKRKRKVQGMPQSQTTGGFNALLQLANFTLGPDATLNTEIPPLFRPHNTPNSNSKTDIDKQNFLPSSSERISRTMQRGYRRTQSLSQLRKVHTYHVTTRENQTVL